ncbi:hypothetical protein [Ellagibacter isourolithinifaciens]|uniref:hypothetical protein n=1 Tax=Ellagibacter isourolithinifaciens TaxID=2137581 RepID=UPI002E781083|nr:hypothetical protein [Ellagibacter isourolithinifaciens]MEE0246162.1 hypothetical protein [Ellagibacter isourolithinifaciens]
MDSRNQQRAGARSSARTGGASSRDRGGASRPSSAKKRRKWPFVVAGAVVLIVVAVVVAFSCWRWTFANDAQDIQGTWYIAGTQKTVDVTADGIKLADDVTYSYTIDEGAKTLSLSFGNMEGEARYRFSLDRQTLALRDGETTWGNSLSEDISWTIAALGRAIQGEQASPELSGDSTMVLTRTPQDLSSEGASGAAAFQAASQGTASQPAASQGA